MGVFDFLTDVGSSLFGDGDEAEKIEEMLQEELGDKMQDVKAEVSDGIVTLSGSCDSRATLEKAALLAGNVEGVSGVDVTNLEILVPEVEDSEISEESEEESEPPALAEEEPSEFYEIQSGDTLSKIAKNFYGSSGKYPLIFEANREVIKDPDKIYPGQKIRIPSQA